MAEYIEREAAIKSAVCALNGVSQIVAVDVVDALEGVPAADVSEVQYGCWRVIENRLHLDVKCSVCNSSFYVYKQGQYRIDQSNYCPNCGAKMDGKGEGE